MVRNAKRTVVLINLFTIFAICSCFLVSYRVRAPRYARLPASKLLHRNKIVPRPLRRWLQTRSCTETIPGRPNVCTTLSLNFSGAKRDYTNMQFNCTILPSPWSWRSMDGKNRAMLASYGIIKIVTTT